MSEPIETVRGLIFTYNDEEAPDWLPIRWAAWKCGVAGLALAAMCFLLRDSWAGFYVLGAGNGILGLCLLDQAVAEKRAGKKL